MSFGYAHVLEKNHNFHRNFAHEIIASILDLDKPGVTHPDRYTKDDIVNKKTKFGEMWHEFDWTKMLDN